VRVTGEVERRGQSAREGEAVQNGTGKRVRARAMLKRSWGVWQGDVAEDLSVRARVRACWSTAGAGKAELTGRSHDVARERERERAHGGNSLASGEAGPRGREGEERTGEGNRCR
jgi:hypothetical protein